MDPSAINEYTKEKSWSRELQKIFVCHRRFDIKRLKTCFYKENHQKTRPKVYRFGLRDKQKKQNKQKKKKKKKKKRKKKKEKKTDEKSQKEKKS